MQQSGWRRYYLYGRDFRALLPTWGGEVSANDWRWGEDLAAHPLIAVRVMLGTAEKAGSGVDKILSGWKDANWRRPIFITKSRPDKCVLTMELTSIMDKEVEDRLTELFGQNILSVEHTRLMILYFACVDSMVSNESLRYSLDLHKAEIAELLKDMCNAGLLVSKGYGRGTTYHLPDKVASSEDERLEAQDRKVGSSETERLEAQDRKVGSSETERLEAQKGQE